MKLLLQRPPNWLWTALGIVRGLNPSHLATDLVPTVDALQGGQGLGVWEDFDFPGNVGSGVGPSTIFTTQRVRSPEFAYLMRCEFRNPGTAGADFTIRCLGPRGNGLRLASVAALGAGLIRSWTEVGAGAPFWFIPPDYDLTIQLGAFTTTAGGVYIHLCRVPAGSKAW